MAMSTKIRSTKRDFGKQNSRIAKGWGTVLTGKDMVVGKVDLNLPKLKCSHGVWGAVNGWSASCSLCQDDRRALAARQKTSLVSSDAA